MNINIIAIGSFKKSEYYEAIFNEYKKRTKININLKELNCKGNLPDNIIKESEGELIISALSKNSQVVILDERGQDFTTPQLQNYIFGNLDSGKTIDFVIGGANGLGENIKKRANLAICFGRMVMPHMMIRAILMEQIYRCWTLQNNHPYHK